MRKVTSHEGAHKGDTEKTEAVLEGKMGRPGPWGSQQGPGVCIVHVCAGACSRVHVFKCVPEGTLSAAGLDTPTSFPVS